MALRALCQQSQVSKALYKKPIKTLECIKKNFNLANNMRKQQLAYLEKQLVIAENLDTNKRKASTAPKGDAPLEKRQRVSGVLSSNLSLFPSNQHDSSQTDKSRPETFTPHAL